MTDIWNIKLKTLENTIIEVNIDSSKSILDLKNEIFNTYKYKPHLQKLIFKGKQLKDEQIISNVITSSGLTIHLLIKDESVDNPIIEDQNTNNRTNNLNNLNNQSQSQQQSQQQPQPQQPNPPMNNLFSNFGSIFNNVMSNPEISNLLNNNSNQPFDLNAILNTTMRVVRDNVGTTNQTQPTQDNNRQSSSTRNNTTNTSNSNSLQEDFNAFYNSAQNSINAFVGLNSQQSFEHFNLVSSIEQNDNLNTKVSNWIRNYVHGMTLFLPNLTQLANIIDNEGRIRNENYRNQANELLRKINEGMKLASDTTNETKRLVRSIKIGNQPNDLRVEPTQLTINTTIITNAVASPELISNQPIQSQIISISNSTSTNQTQQNQPQQTNPLASMLNNLLTSFANPQSNVNQTNPTQPQQSNTITNIQVSKENILSALKSNKNIEDLYNIFKILQPNNKIFNKIKAKPTSLIEKLIFSKDFLIIRDLKLELISEIDLTSNFDSIKEYLYEILSEVFAIEETDIMKIITENGVDIENEKEVFIFNILNDIKLNKVSDFGLVFKKNFHIFLGKIYFSISNSLSNSFEGGLYVISNAIKRILIKIFGENIVSIFINEEIITDQSIEKFVHLVIKDYEETYKDLNDGVQYEESVFDLSNEIFNEIIIADKRKAVNNMDKISSFYIGTSNY